MSQNDPTIVANNAAVTIQANSVIDTRVSGDVLVFQNVESESGIRCNQEFYAQSVRCDAFDMTGSGANKKLQFYELKAAGAVEISDTDVSGLVITSQSYVSITNCTGKITAIVCDGIVILDSPALTVGAVYADSYGTVTATVGSQLDNTSPPAGYQTQFTYTNYSDGSGDWVRLDESIVYSGTTYTTYSDFENIDLIRKPNKEADELNTELTSRPSLKSIPWTEADETTYWRTYASANGAAAYAPVLSETLGYLKTGTFCKYIANSNTSNTNYDVDLYFDTPPATGTQEIGIYAKLVTNGSSFAALVGSIKFKNTFYNHNYDPNVLGSAGPEFVKCHASLGWVDNIADSSYLSLGNAASVAKRKYPKIACDDSKSHDVPLYRNNKLQLQVRENAAVLLVNGKKIMHIDLTAITNNSYPGSADGGKRGFYVKIDNGAYSESASKKYAKITGFVSKHTTEDIDTATQEALVADSYPNHFIKFDRGGRFSKNTQMKLLDDQENKTSIHRGALESLGSVATNYPWVVQNPGIKIVTGILPQLYYFTRKPPSANMTTEVKFMVGAGESFEIGIAHRLSISGMTPVDSLATAEAEENRQLTNYYTNNAESAIGVLSLLRCEYDSQTQTDTFKAYIGVAEHLASSSSFVLDYPSANISAAIATSINRVSDASLGTVWDKALPKISNENTLTVTVHGGVAVMYLNGTPIYKSTDYGLESGYLGDTFVGVVGVQGYQYSNSNNKRFMITDISSSQSYNQPDTGFDIPYEPPPVADTRLLYDVFAGTAGVTVAGKLANKGGTWHVTDVETPWTQGLSYPGATQLVLNGNNDKADPYDTTGGAAVCKYPYTSNYQDSQQKKIWYNDGVISVPDYSVELVFEFPTTMPATEKYAFTIPLFAKLSKDGTTETSYSGLQAGMHISVAEGGGEYSPGFYIDWFDTYQLPWFGFPAWNNPPKNTYRSSPKIEMIPGNAELYRWSGVNKIKLSIYGRYAYLYYNDIAVMKRYIGPKTSNDTKYSRGGMTGFGLQATNSTGYNTDGPWPRNLVVHYFNVMPVEADPAPTITTYWYEPIVTTPTTHVTYDFNDATNPLVGNISPTLDDYYNANIYYLSDVMPQGNYITTPTNTTEYAVGTYGIVSNKLQRKNTTGTAITNMLMFYNNNPGIEYWEEFTFTRNFSSGSEEIYIGRGPVVAGVTNGSASFTVIESGDLFYFVIQANGDVVINKRTFTWSYANKRYDLVTTSINTSVKLYNNIAYLFKLHSVQDPSTLIHTQTLYIDGTAAGSFDLVSNPEMLTIVSFNHSAGTLTALTLDDYNVKTPGAIDYTLEANWP